MKQICLFFLAGQTAFTAFLKSEFSQENIEFWRACEDYKKTSAEKMATKAKQIFDQYVEMDSPNEVNIIFKWFWLKQFYIFSYIGLDIKMFTRKYLFAYFKFWICGNVRKKLSWNEKLSL